MPFSSQYSFGDRARRYRELHKVDNDKRRDELRKRKDDHPKQKFGFASHFDSLKEPSLFHNSNNKPFMINSKYDRNDRFTPNYRYSSNHSNNNNNNFYNNNGTTHEQNSRFSRFSFHESRDFPKQNEEEKGNFFNDYWKQWSYPPSITEERFRRIDNVSDTELKNQRFSLRDCTKKWSETKKDDKTKTNKGQRTISPTFQGGALKSPFFSYDHIFCKTQGATNSGPKGALVGSKGDINGTNGAAAGAKEVSAEANKESRKVSRHPSIRIPTGGMVSVEEDADEDSDWSSDKNEVENNRVKYTKSAGPGATRAQSTNARPRSENGISKLLENVFYGDSDDEQEKINRKSRRMMFERKEEEPYSVNNVLVKTMVNLL